MKFLVLVVTQTRHPEQMLSKSASPGTKLVTKVTFIPSDQAPPVNIPCLPSARTMHTRCISQARPVRAVYLFFDRKFSIKNFVD